MLNLRIRATRCPLTVTLIIIVVSVSQDEGPSIFNQTFPDGRRFEVTGSVVIATRLVKLFL